MDKKLNCAFISSIATIIIAVISILFAGVLGFMLIIGKEVATPALIISFIVIYVAEFIAYLFVMLGFLHIAKLAKNRFLRITSILSIIYAIYGTVISYFLFFNKPQLLSSAGIQTFLIVYLPAGIIYILFGASLLPVHKKVPIAKATGILFMISGVLYLAWILNIIGVFVLLAAYICTIIFFAKARHVFSEKKEAVAKKKAVKKKK